MNTIRLSALRTAKHLAAATLCVGLLTGTALQVSAKDDAPVDDQTAPMPIPKDPHVMVLFSGKPEEISENWVKQGSDQPPTWQIKNGGMVTSQSSIATKQKFKDFPSPCRVQSALYAGGAWAGARKQRHRAAGNL